MVVDANTYGTVERVQRMIGDLVSSRLFTTSTVPTLAQVEDTLNDIADILNTELKLHGYTVPVSVATDPEAFRLLRYTNSAGASGAILAQLATESSSGFSINATEHAVNRKQFFNSQLARTLERIRAGELPAARTLDKSHFAVAGSAKDTDGNLKRPFFTRDIFTNPGSFVFTEADEDS